jgi:hypothetical protein
LIYKDADFYLIENKLYNFELDHSTIGEVSSISTECKVKIGYSIDREISMKRLDSNTFSFRFNSNKVTQCEIKLSSDLGEKSFNIFRR